MLSTVEVRLNLSESMVAKLRSHARVRDISEEIVVEQALNQLFALDETPVINDYWFSAATLREDWDTMPDDWMADEVANRPNSILNLAALRAILPIEK